MPGISAGTLALIMGIYEKIIFSITSLVSLSISKKYFIFLLCLATGISFAFLLLAEGISQLLFHFPLEVYSSFTGLITASLPMLFKLTNKNKHSILIITLVALGFFIFLKTVPRFSGAQDSFFLFFMSGFLGFFASILPGLSGSTVLLILGTYHLILTTLAEGVIKYLLIFSIGGIIGSICAFYFIRFLIKKRKNLFFCTILGLIIGSLPEIIPWKKWSSMGKADAIITTITFILIGGVLFFLVEKLRFLNKKSNRNLHIERNHL